MVYEEAIKLYEHQSYSSLWTRTEHCLSKHCNSCIEIVIELGVGTEGFPEFYIDVISPYVDDFDMNEVESFTSDNLKEAVMLGEEACEKMRKLLADDYVSLFDY